MQVIGVICEYNPLHLGHKKQLDLLRQGDPDCGIVCLMSGNYVQRGMPAILDKTLRAKAAMACGADLVLELPLVYSLSSAEGFAAGGVSLLKNICDKLCFGAENPEPEALMSTARALLSEEFKPILRRYLEEGLSFPAARQKALEEMGLDGSILSAPNNILAVEYCKAILAQEADLIPCPIYRAGDYHDSKPDPENPSATAIRQQMLAGEAWQAYVPEAAREIFSLCRLHSLDAGQRGILARLRTMTEAEFEALPYGSEGLWRKLMHAARQEATLEDILTAVKSKRYTRTRLDRMVMCAFLGLTRQDMESPAPYARVLALNEKGRKILKDARLSGLFPNTGEDTGHPYQKIEQRAEDLYGLFALDAPSPAGAERKRRIFYQP